MNERLWTLIDRIEVKTPPHQFKVILKLEESNSDSISPSVFELCCGACPQTTAHLLGCLCFQLLPLPAHQDFLLQHLNNTKPPTVSSFCPGPVVSKQLLYLLCLPKSATTSEHSHLKLAHFAHDPWPSSNRCTGYACRSLLHLNNTKSLQASSVCPVLYARQSLLQHLNSHPGSAHFAMGL